MARARGARNVWIKCAACGTRCLVRVAERRRGNGKFCSRSCSVTHSNNKRPKLGKTKYTYAESKARYGDTFVINQIVMRIRARAKKALIPCSFTAAQFRKLWDQQGGCCAYTGRKLLLGVNTRAKMHADSVSVDRICPEKGYVAGNMKLCCRWVNSAKGQDTLSNLIARAKEFIAYNT